MKSLAICALIQNEGHFLAEWIEFHRLVGVSKFILYDDCSTDDTLDVLRQRARGDIIFHSYSGSWDCERYDGPHNNLGCHKSNQMHAFNHFSQNHSDVAEWCAFIDPDEFLYHTEFDSIPSFLGRFPGVPAVVANWMIFGSNGHQDRPAGLTTEAYTRRGEAGEPDPYGRHVKPIVCMASGPRWGPNGSHCPVYDSPGVLPVDHNGNPNPWSMRPEAEDFGLLVNHYYHRSHKEAAAKLVRGYHNIPAGYPGKDRLDAHDRNEVEDRRILRFLPKLQKELGCTSTQTPTT